MSPMRLFRNSVFQFFAICQLAVMTVACDSSPTARPNGYMRIGLPTKEYAEIESALPYSFDLNKSAEFKIKDSTMFWADVLYPTLLSTIQITYKPVHNNLDELVRDAQKLAYKHTVKASGMREQFFSYAENNIHGLYYEMSGESASTTQFYATDSTNHFIRGVLYHYSSPNPDSLAPVTAFMREEMLALISSLKWSKLDTVQPVLD